MLEEIRFPEPVISQSLIPDKNVDETKLAEALGKLVRDDPTLQPQDRSGNQPAHPQRHGRAAPGSRRAQAAARSRRQGDGRQADGGLSADAGQADRVRDPLHQADRAAAASSPSSTCASSRSPRSSSRRWRPSWRKRATSPIRTASTSSTRSSAARCRRVHPVGRGRASALACAKGAKYGFPVRGHPGHAAGRQGPRRRQLGRTRSSWRPSRASATPRPRRA